eukprot:TRINITY_DN1835_c1_g1_i1.p1 TRINITY_DN1835_c1_g1~~TRINITY_DN1835_c1_g1_i1.p1  ORF type:complete len:509 (+),score=124.36 TRINITY_DN1835_c1_g1_i1:120-1646(+)
MTSKPCQLVPRGQTINAMILSAACLLGLLIILSSSGSFPRCKRRIVVVGGGVAGLSAAIESASLGACVYIVEQEERVGGNTNFALEGVSSVFTNAQYESRLSDGFNKFRVDLGDIRMKEQFVQQGSTVFEFLMSRGVDLNVVQASPGHTVPRVHRGNWTTRPFFGENVVDALLHAIKTRYRSRIRVITQTRVQSLLECLGGRVCGVTIKQVGSTDDMNGGELMNHGQHYHRSKNDNAIVADGVIIATGGFRYEKQERGSEGASHHHHHVDGSGIQMCNELGANLIEMDKLYMHPMCLEKPGSGLKDGHFVVVSSLLMSPDAILVCSSSGKVVENRHQYRSSLSSLADSIIETCGSDEEILLIIPSQKVRESDQLGPIISAYATIEFAHQFSSLQEFVENGLHKGMKEFVQSRRHPFIQGPLWVLGGLPCVHSAVGGVDVDDQTRVLRPDGSVIHGLYAAGEVVGGLQDLSRGYVEGNSMFCSVIVGRRAAMAAITMEDRFLSSGEEEE